MWIYNLFIAISQVTRGFFVRVLLTLMQQLNCFCFNFLGSKFSLKSTCIYLCYFYRKWQIGCLCVNPECPSLSSAATW